MITKEEFSEYIRKYRVFEDAFNRIKKALMGKEYSSNMYESDWYQAVGGMLNIFLDTHFTEQGADWINYWLFEYGDKIVYFSKDLFDEERKYTLDSLDDLWNFLISDKETYFKNV